VIAFDKFQACISNFYLSHAAASGSRSGRATKNATQLSDCFAINAAAGDRAALQKKGLIRPQLSKRGEHK
jgi:hypothetical protein